MLAVRVGDVALLLGVDDGRPIGGQALLEQVIAHRDVVIAGVVVPAANADNFVEHLLSFSRLLLAGA